MVILSTLMAPTIASAAKIEFFDINGYLKNNLTKNSIFSEAVFTETFYLGLDSQVVPDTGIPEYKLNSWNILFTANNGELFEFSDGEFGDSATMYLSSTTLTELLDSDPETCTFNAFRSGCVQNIQSNNGQLEPTFLGSASFVAESVSSVPEASTLAMLGLGSLMVFGLARRNRKSSSVKIA